MVSESPGSQWRRSFGKFFVVFNSKGARSPAPPLAFAKWWLFPFSLVQEPDQLGSLKTFLYFFSLLCAPSIYDDSSKGQCVNWVHFGDFRSVQCLYLPLFPNIPSFIHTQMEPNTDVNNKSNSPYYEWANRVPISAANKDRFLSHPPTDQQRLDAYSQTLAAQHPLHNEPIPQSQRRKADSYFVFDESDNFSKVDVDNNDLVAADATISKDLTNGTATQELELFRALGAKFGVTLSLPKHLEAEDPATGPSVSTRLPIDPEKAKTLLLKTLTNSSAETYDCASA